MQLTKGVDFDLEELDDDICKLDLVLFWGQNVIKKMTESSDLNI